MSNEQIVNKTYLYAIGGNKEWVSNNQVGIEPGQFRDSTNSYDIVIGTEVTISTNVNGLNGLDTGTVANNTWYYIYAIGDSLNYKPGGYVFSASPTAPTLPFGYDVYRLTGFARTDGSANLLPFSIVGESNTRTFYWINSVQVLTAGTATALTLFSLAAALPQVDNSAVNITVDFTPNSATNRVSIAPGRSAPSVMPHVIGQVDNVKISSQLNVISKIDTVSSASVPALKYINSAASCSTDVFVDTFSYSI